MPFNIESKVLDMASLVESDGLSTWRLLEPMFYAWVRKGEFDIIAVPVGFETDLASIPSSAKWFASNDDAKLRRPAIVHDFLYRSGGVTPFKTFTRQDADRIFYRALLDEGVGWLRAKLMHIAVRIGGASSWAVKTPLESEIDV